jgi:hypothetical protein
MSISDDLKQLVAEAKGVLEGLADDVKPLVERARSLLEQVLSAGADAEVSAGADAGATVDTPVGDVGASTDTGTDVSAS